MLDLAIPMDENRNGERIVETNDGRRLVAPDWPSDYESRLVAFSPKGRVCDVVDADALSDDIAQALAVINNLGNAKLRKTDWHRRLTKYSRGSADQ